MKKSAILSCAAVLLFLTGCFLAERPITRRAVSLDFAVPVEQSKMSLAVSDTEVQEALKIIDAVLVSDGLGSKDPASSVSSESGYVCGYFRRIGMDPRPIGGADVYLKGNRLDVRFIEFGNRSGHFSPATQSILKKLQKELSGRFGARRVSMVKN
jgi:hypothetical protein